MKKIILRFALLVMLLIMVACVTAGGGGGGGYDPCGPAGWTANWCGVY